MEDVTYQINKNDDYVEDVTDQTNEECPALFTFKGVCQRCFGNGKDTKLNNDDMKILHQTKLENNQSVVVEFQFANKPCVKCTEVGDLHAFYDGPTDIRLELK